MENFQFFTFSKIFLDIHMSEKSANNVAIVLMQLGFIKSPFSSKSKKIGNTDLDKFVSKTDFWSD